MSDLKSMSYDKLVAHFMKGEPKPEPVDNNAALDDIVAGLKGFAEGAKFISPSFVAARPLTPSKRAYVESDDCGYE